MSEQKRYTAQEMRDTAELVFAVSPNLGEGECDEVVAMLRQAADAEEELARVNALIGAVQKSLDEHQDCHKCKSYPHCDGSGCLCAVAEITDTLRAARGEGGVK